jgi:hypothetical protein
MPAESQQPSKSWIIPAVLSAAVLTMGVGGWLAFRNMDIVPPESKTPAANAPQPDGDTGTLKETPGAATRGKKSPKAFGLPVYPTAFDFQSMEAGKASASSSFLVKKGDAADLVRYYIEKLGEAGWEFQWKRSAATHPGDVGKTITLNGTRVRWISRKEGRQLTLLALDDIQKGRSAQGVLSWAPLPRKR